MTSILLRLWFLGTIIWIGYGVLEYKGGISALLKKPWQKAWEVGMNNLYCEFKLEKLCKSISASYWERTELNETFALIVKFVGIPAGIFAAILVSAIFFRR